MTTEKKNPYEKKTTTEVLEALQDQELKDDDYTQALQALSTRPGFAEINQALRSLQAQLANVEEILRNHTHDRSGRPALPLER